MNTPPRICFVAPNAYPLLSAREDISVIGGAELQQVIVARGLAARGYEVSMVCLDFGQDDQIVIDGITVFRAHGPTEGLPVLRFLWPRLTSIWRCLGKADADIYYQRTAGMMTGVVAAYARRFERRAVFAAAGNPDLEPNTPRIRFARDRRIYEYGLRRVDRIIVQNNEQARLCEEHLGRSAILVQNCYPKPANLPSTPGNKILWVSTIRKLKRPALFLDLAESLPQYEFQMIGGPDQEEIPLYREISERAAGMPNVEFLGFVPFHQVERYFDSAMIFVNTSESEGFPNTFLQSWSRAIPTVSFFDSGASWNGQRVGVIVDHMESLVASVHDLAQDSDQRSSIGAVALEYYAHNHSVDHVIDQYAEIFSDLLDKG